MVSVQTIQRLLGLALTSLLACDPALDEPAPAVPVVQNVTYNTANTTNICAPPLPVVVPGPEPTTPAVAPAPATGPVAHEAALPVLPPVVVEPPLAAPRRMDRRSTGVAVCDAYLARLETCTRHLMSQQSDATYGRIQETFDLMRRNWRRAAQSGLGRESLVDSCETSLRTYNASVRDQCP